MVVAELPVDRTSDERRRSSEQAPESSFAPELERRSSVASFEGPAAIEWKRSVEDTERERRRRLVLHDLDGGLDLPSEGRMHLLEALADAERAIGLSAHLDGRRLPLRELRGIGEDGEHVLGRCVDLDPLLDLHVDYSGGVSHSPKVNAKSPLDVTCWTPATLATTPPLGARMLKNVASVNPYLPSTKRMLPADEFAPTSR